MLIPHGAQALGTVGDYVYSTAAQIMDQSAAQWACCLLRGNHHFGREGKKDKH